MSLVLKKSYALALLLLCGAPCIAGSINPPQLISSSFGSEFDPAISPNGRYLAYTSDAGGNEDIWLLDLRDHSRRKVTYNTLSDYSPCFLGNDKLVFISTRASSGGEIYVTDLKGKNIRRIIGGDGYFDSPAVSPDRKTIAYIHKKDDEDIRIYFYNLKSEETARGPIGVDPAFAPSGESMIFVGADDISESPGRLMLYYLREDSVRIIDRGPGVVSNPAFYPDGKRVVFAGYTTDSDNDGSVTRNDNPELMIYDPEHGSGATRLYPGFPFGEPAISSKGKIFAVSGDGDIYSLSTDGPSQRLQSAAEQSALCDSLLSYLITQDDSLIAAGGCFSAYNYYPDTCKDYLLVAADIYGALDMTDLALDILRPAIEGDSREFSALARLRAGNIKFSAFKAESQSKAWYDAHRLARDVIESEGLEPVIVKDAYLFGIEKSHISGRLREGNSLIVEALLRFTGDEETIATLEMWRLRNITGAYVGDPMDLGPLYIDYLDRFSERPALLDSAISDLIKLTRTLDDDIAIGELENIQASYPKHRKLAVAALYEQGERFIRSGRRGLAEWKYRAIIDNFREFPTSRFLAFERLGNVRLAEADFEVADAYFDSALQYLGHIESHTSRLEFRREFGSLKTMRGYDVTARDPQKAEIYFRQAIDADPENYEAIWGLAKALAMADGWNRWEDVGRIITDENKETYFSALRYITEYEIERKPASLKKARRLLLKAIDQDHRFPPPYLSLGYVDCLLESESRKALGLYEEAVDVSLRGVSLSRKNPLLKAALLLNAADAYYGLGQYRMAYENYTKSMERDSTVITGQGTRSLLAKLGESAFQIDSLEEASAHYEELYLQAAAASDGSAQAIYAGKLGVIYLLMGRYLKALEYYETAFPFYSSKDDYQMMANLMKCAAVCYASFGNDSLAATAAQRALRYLGQGKDHRVTAGDRVKLIIWPFGLEIPTIRLEPMNYGGSIYPKGFSIAADKALLTNLARRENGSLDAVNTVKEVLRIFSEGKEEAKTGGIWNALGRAYFKMGYLDSAAAAFQEGYRLSIMQDDYITAYIDLVNWAVTVLSPALGSSSEFYIDNHTKLLEESLKLYERIPPAYGPARANLKNIAGVAEFKLSLVNMGSAVLEVDADFESWLESLRREAEKYKSSLERSRFLFREGISEVAFGEDPGLAATLSLNEAILSQAIGDADGYRTAVSRAMEEAKLSGSEVVYARTIGVKGLHSEMELEDRKSLIAKSIASFKDLPPGQLVLNEMPFIVSLYAGAIRTELELGDSLSALDYLEGWRGLELLSAVNMHSYDFLDDDLLKAYITQAKRYREELTLLGANQRRFEALGISGQIELKKIKAQKLELQSQFLDIKEKISEMNSTISSRLFLNISSPQNVIAGIPSEEICIIPYRYADDAILWLCDSTGIETVRIDPEMSNLKDILRAKLDHSKIISIALDDDFEDRLIEPLQRGFPEKKIEHCFSLAEAYDQKRPVPLKLDGPAVVRFEGSIIDDSLVKKMGAGFLAPDSLLVSSTAEKYGWLLFDGKLYYDRENPIMSYWKYSGVSDSIDSESKFYLNDMLGISMASSGAIFPGFFEDAKATERWAALSALFDTGLQTIITIPGSLSDRKSLTLIEEFFGNLEKLSALEAFSYARHALIEATGFTGGIPKYYGHSGWDPMDMESESVAWYKESLFAGYQATIGGDWGKAVEYYILARRQSETAGLSPDENRSITKRLVDGYINLGDYESALNVQMSYIKTVAKDTAALISEWRRYQQIASDAGDVDRSIPALQRMIKIADSIHDTSLQAGFYMELAESYYAQNEISRTVESAGKAIELSYVIADSLVLAGGFNISGSARLLSGSYQNAESDLRSAEFIYGAIGEANGQNTALLSLGEVYGKTGRHISGRAVLKSALEYFTDAGESQKKQRCLILLAENYLKSWQPQVARKYIDMILENEAGNPDALLLLSELMHRRGLQDSSYGIGLEALNAARATQASKHISEAHHNLGSVLYSMHKFDLAIDQYLLALEFRSRDTIDSYPGLLSYKLAATRGKIGYNQDSVYMQIREESPDDFIKNLCSYQIGIGLLAGGKKEQARELFTEILGSDEGYTARFLKWRSLYNLGLASDDDSYLAFILQADSASRGYPPEPDFIRYEYALDAALDDLVFAIAGVKMKGGDLTGAIDFHEKGFLSKIAALHLSSGNFDDNEARLIDNYLQSMEQDQKASFRRILAEFLSGQPRYSPLWGEPESSIKSLMQNLSESQCVIRFYERPSSTILFYVDRDTISYNIIEVDSEVISKTAELMPDMLKYQAKGDSVLEEWYRMLIMPFENLMENREEILLVPDGAFVRYPLEGLKRPEADYLAEMFSLTRSVHLPKKFPSKLDRVLLPCFAESDPDGYDITMGIAGSLSRAVGDCLGDTDDFVRFSLDRYMASGEIVKGAILCHIKPTRYDGGNDWRLGTLQARRDGYEGTIQTLWKIPNQALSHYYWTFLNNLRHGKGLRQSHKAAASYIFGRYSGVPYYWANSAPYNLN